MRWPSFRYVCIVEPVDKMYDEIATYNIGFCILRVVESHGAECIVAALQQIIYFESDCCLFVLEEVF